MRLLQAFWGHKPHQGLSETIGRAVCVTERPVTSRAGATRPHSRGTAATGEPDGETSQRSEGCAGLRERRRFGCCHSGSGGAGWGLVCACGRNHHTRGGSLSGGRWGRGQSRAHRRDRLVSRRSSSSDTRRAFRWLGGVNEVVGAIAVEGRLFGGCGVVLWAGLRDAVSGTQSFCFTSG